MADTMTFGLPEVRRSVETLREIVVPSITKSISIPVYPLNIGPFDQGSRKNLSAFINTHCINDPYQLVALYIGSKKTPLGFYPLKLFTLPFLWPGRIYQEYRKILSKVIAPYLSFDDGIYTDREFNPESIGLEALLAICDAKKALAEIPVQDILYTVIPFKDKDLGFYSNRTSTQKANETEKTVAEVTHDMVKAQLEAVGIIIPGQDDENVTIKLKDLDDFDPNWAIIERISNAISEMLSPSPSPPPQRDAVSAKNVNEKTNWFFTSLVEKVPVETGKVEGYKYMCLKPDSVAEVLDLLRFLTLENANIPINSYEKLPSIPTAKAVVISYMIIEALIINQQYALTREFIGYLRSLGISTPRLDDYFTKASSSE